MRPIASRSRLRRKRRATRHFVFCGRKLPWALWAAETSRALSHPEDYLPEPLTAVGYGDPTFAALYANCRSIFGLHDAYAGPTEDLRYEVLGWYSDPSQDCLARLRQGWLASHLRQARTSCCMRCAPSIAGFLPVLPACPIG